MSETPVTFARVCLCGVETAIASAGEKWVFLVHLPVAEVTPVSPVLCWGRAVVLLVSTSPRCRASVKSWGCAQVVDGLFVWLRCRWAAVGPGGSRRPIGGRREACWAWPGFETTRRAKLVARTASGRAGLAPPGSVVAKLPPGSVVVELPPGGVVVELPPGGVVAKLPRGSEVGRNSASGGVEVEEGD